MFTAWYNCRTHGQSSRSWKKKKRVIARQLEGKKKILCDEGSECRRKPEYMTVETAIIIIIPMYYLENEQVNREM